MREWHAETLLERTGAIALWTVLPALTFVIRTPAQEFVNAQLQWHAPVLDGQRKLLAWYEPEKHLGYDHVARLAWDFIEHKVPIDTRTHTGLKIYLINAVFDGQTLQGTNWQGNPASTFGQFVDSLVSWYPYSADEEAIGVVRSMLDHQLAHGTTPADWKWPRVPFATTCDDDPEYGGCLRGMPREFKAGIETDKVGELGIGYALFFEMTGEQKYLDAAVACGDALAKHVRAGDDTHTPWPFRIDARTGEAINGEEYGGMIVAPVRLFDELLRLKAGDAGNLAKARDLAWKWLLKYPFQNNRWSGYFEDVAKDTDNVNQASPTMTCYYLLAHRDPASIDPDWSGHVGHMLDWVRLKLGRGPFFGAWAIDEQGKPPEYRACCSRAGLGSDTSRWGAINAMYYEKTGDAQAREDAFRSLNYATYFAASDGKVSCCGSDYHDQYWFDDGYADYIRHFMWAMGAIPEFAPKHENHLLRSTSIVQKVRYGKQRIEYRTFDAASTEVARLNFKPMQITAGGESLSQKPELLPESFTVTALEEGDYVVRIRHGEARDVAISRD